MSHANQITDPRDALAYLVAGNATVTLVSKKTGTRFTYKVKQPEAGSDRRFVGLLSGPGNESDYTYMGMLVDAQGARGESPDHRIGDGRWSLRTTKATRVGVDAPSWRAFAWTLHLLQQGKLSPELEFWHEGRCGRCGRKLTVPESIASGLGPVCAGREV